MRFICDASADAAYFYLADRSWSIEARQMDKDVYLQFYEHDQMVGIEVIAASDRLLLSDIGHVMGNLSTNWATLNDACKSNRLEQEARNIPIKASAKKGVWAEDIGIRTIF